MLVVDVCHRQRWTAMRRQLRRPRRSLTRVVDADRDVHGAPGADRRRTRCERIPQGWGSRNESHERRDAVRWVDSRWDNQLTTIGCGNRVSLHNGGCPRSKCGWTATVGARVVGAPVVDVLSALIVSDGVVVAASAAELQPANAAPRQHSTRRKRTTPIRKNRPSRNSISCAS